MKNWVFALTLTVVLAGIASAALAFPDCSDGTKYYICSTKSPGMRCIGTTSSTSLSRDLNCKCEDITGYITQGAGDSSTCILAKCDDNTQPGQCTANKPKVCVGGSTYTDNATLCGCPAGKRVAADKISCEYPPCNYSGETIPDGRCSMVLKQKKCVNGQLVDKASECGCKNGNVTGETCTIYCADGTPVDSCSSNKPKECTLIGIGTGIYTDNAAKCGCPDGKLAVGKLCTDSVLGALGAGADTLGGSPQSNNTGTSGAAGAGGLSCCCLPTALIGLVGGFVFFRKKG